MYPTKAPGLDGTPPLFYQHFWQLVGDCVIKTVLDFLNHGKVPPKFNETYIVLIPKTKNPSKVGLSTGRAESVLDPTWTRLAGVRWRGGGTRNQLPEKSVGSVLGDG